jgi:YVTN family beta-propeller protein
MAAEGDLEIMSMRIKSCTVPLAAFAALTLALPLTAANGGLVRIILTNSAGDSVHIIDATTNKVIAEIPASSARMARRLRPTAA